MKQTINYNVIGLVSQTQQSYSTTKRITESLQRSDSKIQAKCSRAQSQPQPHLAACLNSKCNQPQPRSLILQRACDSWQHRKPLILPWHCSNIPRIWFPSTEQPALCVTNLRSISLNETASKAFPWVIPDLISVRYSFCAVEISLLFMNLSHHPQFV